MASRSDYITIVHDVTAHPAIGKTVAQGTAAASASGLGLGAYLGYFEKGIGLAAACMGLLVTIALWRKLRLERREIELRVQELEQRLEESDPSN